MRRCQWNFSRRSLLIWSFRSRTRCSPMPAASRRVCACVCREYSSRSRWIRSSGWSVSHRGIGAAGRVRKSRAHDPDPTFYDPTPEDHTRRNLNSRASGDIPQDNHPPPTTTPRHAPFWISAIFFVVSLMISRRHFSASGRLSQSEDMKGRRSFSPGHGGWWGWGWGEGGGTHRVPLAASKQAGKQASKQARTYPWRSPSSWSPICSAAPAPSPHCAPWLEEEEDAS